MKVTQEPNDRNLTVNNQVVESVEVFNYLAAFFTKMMTLMKLDDTLQWQRKQWLHSPKSGKTDPSPNAQRSNSYKL